MFAKLIASQFMTNKASSGFQLRLVWALKIFLAAVIIYLLTRTALAYFAPESLWEAPDAIPAMAVTNQPARNTRLETSFDPFHRETAPVDDIIEYGTDVPETTLNLKLFGRRAGPDGTAILEAADKTQKVFRVGDEIMDGVTLKAVHPEYIVLSQGGRIERLTFARDGENMLSIPEDKTSTSSASNSAALVKTIPQDISFNSLMAGINLSPSIKNGQLQGFRISSKSGDETITAFGLKVEDVISAIDGIDVTSSSLNPAQLPARLAGKPQVKLTVLRGSETVFVTLKNKN